MGKGLKKKQKWRNLEISPVAALPRINHQQSKEEEGEDGASSPHHPFLKIVSKNMDIVINQEAMSSSDISRHNNPSPTSPPGLKVLSSYKSENKAPPVFDPANCTVVGGRVMDPASTAMFVGDPLRYATVHHHRAGGQHNNSNHHHYPMPPPLSKKNPPEGLLAVGGPEQNGSASQRGATMSSSQ
jgi:hypothetical protein